MEEDISFDYIRAVITNRKWLILIGALITAIITGVVAMQSKPTYEASVSLTPVAIDAINVVGKQQPLEDAYYGVLTSEKVAPAYSKLIKTPGILEPSAKAAGITGTFEDIKNAVQVELADTRLIKISVSSGSSRKAADFANAISDYITTKDKTLGRVGSIGQGVLIKLIAVDRAAPMPPTKAKRSISFNLLLSSVVGLIFGITLAFVIERFDPSIMDPSDTAPTSGKSESAKVY